MELCNWMVHQECTKVHPVGCMKMNRWARNLMTLQGPDKLTTERCMEPFQGKGGIPPVEWLA